VVVAFHAATLATGRALPLTRTGLSPAGTRQLFLAHQWLAYVLPYRRFADTLASANARLGADADRYSFTVEDFHLLLFAGFDRRTESLEFCTIGDLQIAVA